MEKLKYDTARQRLFFLCLHPFEGKGLNFVNKVRRHPNGFGGATEFTGPLRTTGTGPITTLYGGFFHLFNGFFDGLA